MANHTEALNRAMDHLGLRDTNAAFHTSYRDEAFECAYHTATVLTKDLKASGKVDNYTVDLETRAASNLPSLA